MSKKNRLLRIVGVVFLCIVCAAFFASMDVFAAFAWNEPDWRELDYDKIDEQLKSDVKSYHIPGMAVIVVSPDEVLFSGTYGNCSSIDTPFLIGSMSKSFTALSVMQLAEQGKIELDESIAAYLDCSRYLKDPEDGERITVRQLLNQSSGLDTYHRFGSASITEMYGKHEYANVNYSLLGKIIESVSGESYSDYVEAHIFAPLEMVHTSATLEESRADGLISGYRNFFGIPIAGAPDYPDDASWATVPAGYIGSSAADMGRYLQMYLNGGEDILSEEGIRAMFYDNIPMAENNSSSYYGMGWGLTYTEDDKPILNHSGLNENYTSNMFLFPESEIGVVVLANMNDYLVSNSLLGNIVAPLIGMERQDMPDNIYIILHAIIDAVMLGVLLFGIYPILSLNKWRNKPSSKRKTVWDIIRHAVVPAMLLGLSLLLKTPWWVIYYYAKDVFFVIMLSALLLLLTGIYKLIILRCRSDRSIRQTSEA